MNPQLIEASGACLVAILMTAYAATRPERSRAQQLIIHLMMGMIVWTFGIAASVVLDGEASVIASLLAQSGVFFVPPAWVRLAMDYTPWANSDRLRLLGAILFVPSVALVVALATNDAHHLLLTRTDDILTTEPSSWAGPLFWIWIAWCYSLIALGCGLYLYRSLLRAHRNSGVDRWLGLIFSVAAILPLAASALYTLSDSGSEYDRTPMMLGASVLLIFFADWRYHLLGTIPIARKDVIDDIADGVLLTDATGRLLDINPAAEGFLGASLSRLRGRLLVDVVAEHAQGQVEYRRGRFAERMKSMCESPQRFDVRIENTAGRVFEIRGSSVQDVRGEVNGVYLIVRDCTEQAKYEELLGRIRRHEAVASLAAGVAHEVNNPLAYVRANVCHVTRVLDDLDEVLEAHGAKDDRLAEARAALDESLEGIERIGEVVERVRRLSRSDDEQSGQLSVNRIVEDAIQMSSLAARKDIALSVALGEDLPSINGARNGLTDAVFEVLGCALEELRTNRLDDGSDASGEHGDPRAVAISTHAEGDRVWVEIELDAGPEPAERRRPSQHGLPQVEVLSAYERPRLSIAQQVCQDHGGELTLEARSRGRLCLRLCLPSTRARGVA